MQNGRGSNVDLYKYGDYWIVKSTDVHIQGRYWSSKYRGNSMTRGWVRPRPKPRSSIVSEAFSHTCIFRSLHCLQLYKSRDGKRLLSMRSVFHGGYCDWKRPPLSLLMFLSSRGCSVCQGLAVGGPFLKGNLLMVEPLDGSVKWNGVAVVTTFPSTFEAPDLIYIRYHDRAEVLKRDRAPNVMMCPTPQRPPIPKNN
eukprot:1951082-Amphidinium_carterae.1